MQQWICVSLAVCWSGAGVRELKHRQKADYYKECLGIPIQKAAIGNGIEEDINAPRKSLAKAMGNRGVKRVHSGMAICDDHQEGDPSDDEGAGAGGSAGGSKTNTKGFVDPKLSFKWGEFSFSYVVRQRTRGKMKGAIITQYEVRCPYHKDSDNDTRCTKTCSFEGTDARWQAELALKKWCLLGRHCKTRSGNGGHKKIKLPRKIGKHHEDLDKDLAEAMSHDSWLVDSDDSSMSSISSDSSSDSSSSS